MSGDKLNGDEVVVQVDTRRPQAKQQVQVEKKIDDFSDLIEHLDGMREPQQIIFQQGT